MAAALDGECRRERPLRWHVTGAREHQLLDLGVESRKVMKKILVAAAVRRACKDASLRPKGHTEVRDMALQTEMPDPDTVAVLNQKRYS